MIRREQKYLSQVSCLELAPAEFSIFIIEKIS